MENTNKTSSNMLKNLEKVFSNLLEKDSYNIKYDNDNFKVKINYKIYLK